MSCLSAPEQGPSWLHRPNPLPIRFGYCPTGASSPIEDSIPARPPLRAGTSSSLSTAGWALGGSGALLVEEMPPETEGRPAVFIIANSLGASCSQFAGREEAFGRAILGQISDLTIDEITSDREVVIGGLRGVEHVANGTSESGAPTTVVQTLLFDGCNYLRSIGMAPQREGQPYLPRFRSLAETVRTK